MENVNKRSLVYLVLLVVCLGAVHLSLIGNFNLTTDEAHYWQYANHPELSYFDHPPLVGIVIRFFTGIFGHTEFAVRIGAVICSILTSILIWLLFKDIFNALTAFYSVALFNAIPVFAMGSVLMLPDALLGVLWLATIRVVWKIFKSGRGWLWHIVGITVGLSLLCKYHSVFLVLGIFLALIADSNKHFWFKRKELYFSALLAFAIFLPVLIWNYDNHWASFLWHLAGRHQKGFSLSRFGTFIASQLGYVSPVLLICFFGMFPRLWKRYRYLFWYSVPMLAVFWTASGIGDSKPHWPALGYIPLIPVFIEWVREKKRTTPKIGNTILWVSLVPAIFLTLFVHVQPFHTIIPFPAKVDPATDLVGWPEAASAIKEEIGRVPEPDNCFVFTRWALHSSQLAFYIYPRTVYCINDTQDQYDFWYDNRNLNGKTGIFITDDRFGFKPERYYNFANVIPLEDIVITRGRRIQRKFHLYRCEKFSIPGQIQSFPRRDVVGSLKKWDGKVFLKLNQNFVSPQMDIIMKFFTLTGTLYVLLPIMILLLWLFRRSKFWVNLGVYGLIIGTSSLVVHLLKAGINRARPLKALEWLAQSGAIDIHILFQQLFWRSFPSGHTAVAFATATFLSFLFRKYAPLFMGAAILVGFSRVYVGAHFVTDVVAGAAVAILVSIAFKDLIPPDQERYKVIDKEK